MERAQSKILRTITNASWYVTNHTLHTDLNIPYVSDVISERINKPLRKLESHPNLTCGDTKATDAQQKAKKTLDLRPTRLR